MSLEQFYAEITGNADGLISALGEAEGAASALEDQLAAATGEIDTAAGSADELAGSLDAAGAAADTSGASMVRMGAVSDASIGGTAVKNVSLLDHVFGGVFGSIKNVIGGMVSMVTQTAGIGALIGGGIGLAEGVKLAQQYNEEMGLIAQTYHQMGASVPTAQINTMQAAMTKLGFTEESSNAALLKLAQAHIPVNQQMAAMSAAADLARGKNMDLASAMQLVLMAAQGTGRGLQTLGINLPAVIPKAAALASAEAALTKAQEAYNLALDKYGEYNAKTITAHNALDAATLKVSTDTKEMANHFAQLPTVMTAIESRVGGSAKAYVAANPFATMGADMQTVARVAGEALLPGLDNIAKWVSAHESQLESFATNAVGALGTAAGDAGGFIANDLYPAAKDVVGFLVQNKGAVEGVVGALTGLWAIGKVKSTAGSIIGDLKDLFGGKGLILNAVHALTGLGSGGSGSSSGGLLGGASSIEGVRVFVTNMGAGGMGGGELAGDAGDAAAGAGFLGLGVSAGGLAGIFGALAGPFAFAGFGLVQNLQKMNADIAKARTEREAYNQQVALEAAEEKNAASDFNKAWNNATLAAYGLAHDIQGADNQILASVASFASSMGDANAVASNLGRQAARLASQSGIAPSGGSGSFTANVAKIEINGATNPQQTAAQVRNELLILNRGGQLSTIFGGR